MFKKLTTLFDYSLRFYALKKDYRELKRNQKIIVNRLGALEDLVSELLAQLWQLGEKAQVSADLASRLKHYSESFLNQNLTNIRH